MMKLPLFFLAGGLLLAPAVVREPPVWAQNTVPAVEACCGSGRPMFLKGDIRFFTPPDGPNARADDIAQFTKSASAPRQTTSAFESRFL